MDKNCVCCFSGHRDIPSEKIEHLTRRLFEEIKICLDKGINIFCAGGALGFDTLAAEAVLRMKEIYPEIKLILCLPYPGQSSHWKTANKERYLAILSAADECYYALDQYTKFCMAVRNKMLVDMSGRCICYKTSDKGGTAYTVKLAEKAGLDIINIADEFCGEQISAF